METVILSSRIGYDLLNTILRRKGNEELIKDNWNVFLVFWNINEIKLNLREI